MAVTQETTTRPTNDAYTGMLGISLFALILGCVLLYLDYSQYPDSKGPAIPKAPSVASPGETPAVKVQQPKALPPQKKEAEEPKETADPGEKK
jgi:hypothetical protein